MKRSSLPALAVALCLAAPAAAKSERATYHSVDKVWPSAVRFLRVDQGYSIVDKDADSGYVVFDYIAEERKLRGALELVPTQDSEGHSELRIVLTLDGSPSYIEDMVLDRLMQKLRDEHGDGPPPPRKKKPPEKPAKPDGKGKPTDQAKGKNSV